MSTHSVKSTAVSPVGYDSKVHRRSLDDPSRQHRRSSIPFADRKPAVRFIRSIDLRKASVAGPHGPKSTGHTPNKPILKATHFPILVNSSDVALSKEDKNNSHTFTTTNDELEACRFRAELIMDKVSKAERVSRGSMDVLTFPTSTRRVDALSRYQGCMDICVHTIDYYTQSEDYQKEKKFAEKNKSPAAEAELNAVIDATRSMAAEAESFYSTSKKFLNTARRRYNEWEELLKRNAEFRIEQNKLCYPIYTHKKMPESITLFEDTLDQGATTYGDFDGYLRVFRKVPEGNIYLYCDMPDDKAEEVQKITAPISFFDSTMLTQRHIIKTVTTHGRDLLFYGNLCLKQGLEILEDNELDDAFKTIQNKINSLEYDDYFDPMCALELKTALGELGGRKAELLNTAEQIYLHCKWILRFANNFHKFTKSRIKGKRDCLSCISCSSGSSKVRLLRSLGMVGFDDVTILLPLTPDIFQDVFNINILGERHSEHGTIKSGSSLDLDTHGKH